MLDQGYINHIALVIDASGSMQRLSREVVKVADNQIAYLAQRSKELDQETRITVYTFGNKVECIVYDKDVLRLPSISKYYRVAGMTALVEAAVKSQEDLAHTAQLYGDHAFLTYVLTDGLENYSSTASKAKLPKILDHMPENWTLAVMVPDQQGVFEAKKFGFPANNIAVWDSTTVKGLEEAGSTIRRTTDTFMTQRSTGVRGSRNLFSMGSDVLNTNTVKAARLQDASHDYYVMDVTNYDDIVIANFVQRHGIPYQLGIAYYQLMKPENIQPQKNILVRDKKTGKIFSGRAARDLLGLPDNMTVRVRPTQNPQYDVFVQSTSVNRKLVPGTKLLVSK
jgi:hypothetical protein